MLRFATLSCVLATACSSAPSIAYSEFDQALQGARCERLARCGLVASEATCLGDYHVVPDASVAAAIGAHKLGYDGVRAKQCVDAVARASCDGTAHDVRFLPAACDQMLTGHVAGGDACSIDVECASGTCDLPTTCPERQCCVGTCRPTQAPAPANGSCAKTRDCASGLVCTSAHTCQPPGKVGDACKSDLECADLLACVGGTSTIPGSCHPLPHRNESCSYARCADDNLRCDDTSHTCVPVGLAGTACPTLKECSIYVECDAATHLCREHPTLGTACDGTCTGDSFCAFDVAGKGTCTALQPNGAMCDGNQECLSGFCEDGPVFRGCLDAYVCY